MAAFESSKKDDSNEDGPIPVTFEAWGRWVGGYHCGRGRRDRDLENWGGDSFGEPCLRYTVLFLMKTCLLHMSLSATMTAATTIVMMVVIPIF